MWHKSDPTPQLNVVSLIKTPIYNNPQPIHTHLAHIVLTKCQGVRDATQEPHLQGRGQPRNLKRTQARAHRLPKRNTSQMEPFGHDGGLIVSLVVMHEFTTEL